MTDLDHGADLRERFDRALADADAPDGLAAAALSRGHRLRRRRRLLTAGAGLASVAAVAALVVPGLDNSGAEATTSEFATQPTPTAAPTPTADPGTPSPGPADGDPFPDLPEGWWDAPADLLLDQLRAALPDGVDVVDHQLAPEDRAPGEPDISAGSLSATLDSAEGPGGFQILLRMPTLEELPDPVTTTDAAGNEGTAMLAQGPSNLSQVKCGRQSAYTHKCEEILDADGAPVGRLTSVLQDRTITFYEATLLGPDGGLVYMSAWNATDAKPGPTTPRSAPVPPLSLDQLETLVADPVWTSYTP